MRGAAVTVCEHVGGEVVILYKGRELSCRVHAQHEPGPALVDEKEVSQRVDEVLHRQGEDGRKPAPAHPWRRWNPGYLSSGRRLLTGHFYFGLTQCVEPPPQPGRRTLFQACLSCHGTCPRGVTPINNADRQPARQLRDDPDSRRTIHIMVGNDIFNSRVDQMKTHRTIRYRLPPRTRAKAAVLHGTAGACRFAWNCFTGKLRKDWTPIRWGRCCCSRTIPTQMPNRSAARSSLKVITGMPALCTK